MKFFSLKKFIPELFLFFVICYLLFLISPALLGQLGGTFKKHTVPNEYVQLEKFLSSQNNFSRTLWVPSMQRFGFYSYQHPAVSAEDFFHVASISGVIDMLYKQNTEKMLEDAGVKYVVIPYDSEGEIFLKDRKYSNALYKKTVLDAAKIPWLKKVVTLGKIVVFSVPFPKDHFFLVPINTLRMTNNELHQQSEIRNMQQNNSSMISITMINPTKYNIKVKNVRKGERLVFSESYDKYWLMQETKNRQQITESSQKYESLFNSFVLPQNGSYTLTIFYQPQQWVTKGLFISGATLFVLGGYGLWLLLQIRSKSEKPK